MHAQHYILAKTAKTRQVRQGFNMFYFAGSFWETKEYTEPKETSSRSKRSPRRNEKTETKEKGRLRSYYLKTFSLDSLTP